jgi:hypothetical protein
MNTSVTAESVPFLISLLKMDAFFDIEVAKALSPGISSQPRFDNKAAPLPLLQSHSMAFSDIQGTCIAAD